ncbi:MAG: hypothetical protein ACI9J2_001418 [Saprospiraceae bacterium]|jgi:hypothetical protein
MGRVTAKPKGVIQRIVMGLFDAMMVLLALVMLMRKLKWLLFRLKAILR